MPTRIIVLALAAAVLIANAPTRADSPPFGRIITFGTSLSDPGNAFALRGGTNTPPDYVMDPLLVPAVPYAMGGHHFSNGATWVEQFARSRGLAGDARPAFASHGRGVNYAVGAARAREDGVNLNLPVQVDTFLAEFGSVPPNALCVMEMGGNDIRDAFVAYASGGNGGPILQDAVGAVAQNIQRLYAAGARQFLVWRAPDVGATPALQALDAVNPGAAALATQLTMGFNAGLDAAVSTLQAALPDITIIRLDAFQLIQDLRAHGADYGLSNVTDACVTPNVPPFTCDRPGEYLFWDGIHPTAAAHAIVASRALVAGLGLAEKPEKAGKPE